MSLAGSLVWGIERSSAEPGHREKTAACPSERVRKEAPASTGLVKMIE